MPEARAFEKHGDRYAVRCDCGEEQELRAGAEPWIHDCPAFDPDGGADPRRVSLEIDEDGHMTQRVG